MSALQLGLTPKMRPLSPKRSVLVAALDVGTSKIACVIGRLKRRQPEEVPSLRSHSIDVVGFGHTVARGMKAGGVVDLGEAEAAVRQCVDLAERSAKLQLELGDRLGFCRSSHERAHLRVHRGRRLRYRRA